MHKTFYIILMITLSLFNFSFADNLSRTDYMLSSEDKKVFKDVGPKVSCISYINQKTIKENL